MQQTCQPWHMEHERIDVFFTNKQGSYAASFAFVNQGSAVLCTNLELPS